MTTIDQLDMSVYNLYAIRTRMIEQINTEYRLDQASSIPPQTSVIDLYPRMTELDILLGVVRTMAPFAFYYPPPRLRRLRRSPFSYRVAPSLGTYDEQDQALALLESLDPDDEAEVNEKAALRKLFRQLEQINEWLSFIHGRIGQFLQG